LMNGMPNAKVFCDEHKSAAVLVFASKPGRNFFEICQKIKLNPVVLCLIKNKNQEMNNCFIKKIYI
jgi:hypothetical protein